MAIVMCGTELPSGPNLTLVSTRAAIPRLTSITSSKVGGATATLTLIFIPGLIRFSIRVHDSVDDRRSRP